LENVVTLEDADRRATGSADAEGDPALVARYAS
jgi:hypothetical protein